MTYGGFMGASSVAAPESKGSSATGVGYSPQRCNRRRTLLQWQGILDQGNPRRHCYGQALFYRVLPSIVAAPML